MGGQISKEICPPTFCLQAKRDPFFHRKKWEYGNPIGFHIMKTNINLLLAAAGFMVKRVGVVFFL